jgi:hypothetical protein
MLLLTVVTIKPQSQKQLPENDKVVMGGCTALHCTDCCWQDLFTPPPFSYQGIRDIIFLT